MNIYIPISDFESINRERLSNLKDHRVHIIYEKPVTSDKPKQRRGFEAIKKQKNRILKLGSECGEDFFIMQDSDITHMGAGINLLTNKMTYSYYSALGLWPHKENFYESEHVSTACMIIRAKDVKNLYLDYESGCFCGALTRNFLSRGLKIGYASEDQLVREVVNG